VRGPHPDAGANDLGEVAQGQVLARHPIGGQQDRQPLARGAAAVDRRVRPGAEGIAGQPWIVYNYMKVEEAVTANTGVWIMFIAVVLLYALVGTTLILVLRGMSRRFRRAGGFTDLDTPYGPSALTEGASAREEEAVG
jgi:hypothetical protein